MRSSGDVQLHDIVTALLSEVRKRAPAVLVVEDLHWADEATLDVFRLVARRLEGGRRPRGRDAIGTTVRSRHIRCGSSWASSEDGSGRDATAPAAAVA